MRSIFVTSLLILFILDLVAQVPQIFLSPVMDEGTVVGNSVRQNDSYYFALRIEEVQENRRGFIDTRSKADLSLVSSVPINVPLKNADSFSIEEIAVYGEQVLLFYSFFSKGDAKRTLAVADLDAITGDIGAPRVIHSEPGKRDYRTGEYHIEHHKENGSTTIVIMRPSEGWVAAEIGFYSPEFEVINLDIDLNVIHEGRGTLSDEPKNSVNRIFMSLRGDVYLTFLGSDKIVSYDHSTSSSSIAEVPELSKTDGQIYEHRNYSHFTEAPNGNVYYFKHMCLKKMKDIQNLAGIQVISFDPSNGAYVGAQFFPVVTRDPYTELDKNNKHPAALYHFEYPYHWWNDRNEVVFGMVHERKENITTYVEHSVIVPFDPQSGFGTAHFFAQPRTLSMTQTEVKNVVFMPAGNEVYLVYMDYLKQCRSRYSEAFNAQRDRCDWTCSYDRPFRRKLFWCERASFRKLIQAAIPP